MLKQIWQRLVRFFQQLFGIGTPTQPSPYQGEVETRTCFQTSPSDLDPPKSPLKRGTKIPAPPFFKGGWGGSPGLKTRPSRLSDTEYEQRFMQLLDGVNQGWSRGQVQGFLIAKNLTQADLVAWLQGFGERLRESPQLNDELAQRMVRLSQLGCGELGEVAGEIGRDLLSKSAKPAATNSMDNADSDEAQALFNQGKQQDMKGNLLGAIAYYDQALQIQPDYHQAWNNRGNALSDLGQFEQAIGCFDQALKIQPDVHQAWYNRGNTLSYLGQFEQAIASYDKALQIQPDLHEVWNNRGTLLSKNFGWHEEAIASFDQALQIQPDSHEAWYNRSVAASKSRHYNPQAAIILQGQFPASPVVKLNHTLTRRGYEGELLCYREGLKYCHQDTHPEGWGFLHQAIGYAHYLQGEGKPNYREYWRKAVAEYHQALVTLTPEAFPELHLEVVQKLIRVLFGLGENNEAKQWRLHGLDVFQQLLNSNKTSAQKRHLAVKFISFSQMRVDVLVEDGDLVPALEAAESHKNRYLTWILDAQNEQILSPSYAQIQQLLNPTTAIIYWHLSPFALTTFIIKHGAAEPIVIKEPLPNPLLLGEGVRLLREEGVRIPPPETGGLRGVLQLETWVKNWNKQYQDYGSDKEKELPLQPSLVRREEELEKSWRENLPEMLQQLSNILNIPALLSPLTDINQLILIPHRDLHRFPLHVLFPDTFTITYLPSAQIGITLQKKQAGVGTPHTVPLLSVEHPNSEDFELLPYAEIESAAITQLFNNPTPKRISGQEATKTAVKDALAAGYKIFHFTGHGTYNFDRPKQSALFLSGKDYLTLEEICNIPLSSYQLVTLAACETALTGNQTIDNEYVGLVSAFLSQGVAHVVSTLWTIPEEASSLLMIYFYWQLKKGKPPTLALTKAVKWLRNLTDKKLERLYKVIFAQLPENEKPLHRFLESELEQRLPNLELSKKLQKRFDHPYYWAAFTITGQAHY